MLVVEKEHPRLFVMTITHVKRPEYGYQCIIGPLLRMGFSIRTREVAPLMEF